MHRTLLFAAALLFLVASLLLAGEGFGFSKRLARLNCRTQPGVLRGGITIDVRIKSNLMTEQSELLRHLIEARILTAGLGLRLDHSRPDVIIQLVLEPFDFREHWETAVGTEQKQTGTRQEWNAKKARYESKPVYDQVAVSKNFKRVTGHALAGYEALDQQNNRSLHTAEARARFDQLFEEGIHPPTRAEVERQLLERAADAIMVQLAGAIEPVSVLLPRGSLDGLAPLAERGWWDRYFTAVQNMPEKNRPADEAYRQYALGLGSEGMAYGCGDQEKALAYLRTAESHYRRAAEMKPDEKYFAQALERVRR